MKKGDKTPRIVYKTKKGRTVSLPPEEYAKLEKQIEISGERLLLKQSPPPSPRKR